MPTRKKLPTAGLLAVAIIVVVEVAVGVVMRDHQWDPRYDRFYDTGTAPGVEDSIIQWQVSNAVHAPGRPELLLLGDSSCLTGLKPRVIAERTGLSTWDLGTIAIVYTTGHADMLEYYIRKKGPPRFLVYHVTNYMIETSRQDAEKTQFPARLHKWLRGPQGDLSLAERLLPSYRMRKPIKRGVLGPGGYVGTDLPRKFWPSDDEIRRLLEAGRGHIADNGPVRVPDEFDLPLKFNPDCMEGMARIFKLGRQHGFAVLLLFQPLPDNVDNDSMRGKMSLLEKDLRKAFAPYEDVVTMPPLLRVYPRGMFVSITHLNPDGTERNSTQLAEWINRNWLNKASAGPADANGLAPVGGGVDPQ